MRLTEKKLLQFGFIEAESFAEYKQFELKSELPNEHILVRSIDNEYFTIFNHSYCNRTELQFIKELSLVSDLKRLYYAITDKKLKEND